MSRRNAILPNMNCLYPTTSTLSRTLRYVKTLASAGCVSIFRNELGFIPVFMETVPHDSSRFWIWFSISSLDQRMPAPSGDV